MYRSRKNGFTLSEVLIALALLGIIAAFAIPKIMQTTQKSQRNAILKESLAMLSDLTYEATLSANIQSLEDLNQFLAKKLNTVRICSDYTECYPENTEDVNPDNGAAYFLANGAAIVDVDHFTTPCSPSIPTSCVDSITLDYNGAASPNAWGEDRVGVAINLNSAVSFDLKPGQVGLASNMPQDDANAQLYHELTR